MLDGDTQRLRAPDGRFAVRDVVQFVPLRPNQARCGLWGAETSPCQLPRRGLHSACCLTDCPPSSPLPHVQRETVGSLASQLLAELPGQLVEYFHTMKGIPPPPSKGGSRPAATASLDPVALAVPPQPVIATGVPAPGFPKV